MTLQENVAKVVGATSSEDSLVLTSMQMSFTATVNSRKPTLDHCCSITFIINKVVIRSPHAQLCDNKIKVVRSIIYLFITFCVSRRRRKMYCGNARLCMCVSVCLSVCPRPYAHTTVRTRM